MSIWKSFFYSGHSLKFLFDLCCKDKRNNEILILVTLWCLTKCCEYKCEKGTVVYLTFSTTIPLRCTSTDFNTLMYRCTNSNIYKLYVQAYGF